MVEVPPDVQARREAQRAEYSQWVAVKRIYHNGALAYTPGHPVPASNVKRHGYDKRGLVEQRNKKGSSDAS